MAEERRIARLGVLALAGLKADQLEEIAQRAEKLRFRAGDVVVRAGAPADGAFLIVAGQAEKVHASGEREFLDTGFLIGEMAMLIEQDVQNTIVARDRLLCLKVTRAALMAQMMADPSLADSLHEHMTRRLMQTAEQLRRIDRTLGELWPEQMPSFAAATPGATAQPHGMRA